MTSKAHVILEAVKLSVEAQGEQLLQLVSEQSTLKLEVILRIILTYLPESLDFHIYHDLLVYLSGNVTNRTMTSSLLELGPSYDQLSDIEARERVKRLHLLPLVPSHLRRPGAGITDLDPFTQFLIHRAHRIESETGSLPLVAQLVEPFLDHSDYLRTWAISGLLPLLRLDYDYYANKESTYSLAAFGDLSGHEVVASLLSKAAGKKDKDSGKQVARDLRGLVGPWIYGQKTSKRRKLDTAHRRRSSAASTTSVRDGNTASQDNSAESWAIVNDWLLDLSMRDFPQAADAILHWDGPQDVNYGSWNNESTETELTSSQNLTSRYAQTGLAMIYANDTASMSIIESSHGVLQRVAELTNLASLPELPTITDTLAHRIPEEYFDSLSPTHLFHNTLLRSHNPLTTPSENSLSLGQLLLSSNHILHSFDQPKPCKAILSLAVFGSATDQLAELRRILHGLTARSQDEKLWQSSRNNILRLQDWRNASKTRDSKVSNFYWGLFAKVELPTMEAEILKAMLTSTSYNVAIDTYCRQTYHPLPATEVERIVADVALAFYDSASNGNRTRGGVRKASEMLNAFRTFFPDSVSFQKIGALLKATHAMSFYALTLQHGVPFQPVNIRAHRDPMLLVGKILDQNPRSYTKLDDLLDIGQNLVAASITTGTVKSDFAEDNQQEPAPPSLVARRRIIGMAIEAALREDDFDTAYSYAVNRLQQDSNSAPNEPSGLGDDTSWRAAFKAGCYIDTKASGPSTLRRLEQRMELLSQALLLAPTSALSDILEVWRQCEEDLNSALTQEAEADEKWDARGDQTMPGQFSGYSSPVTQKSREPSRAAMNEEVPMGLFDVARGAAATLSKNASLLGGARNAAGAGALRTVHERSSSQMSGGDDDVGSGHDAEGRVRKRDIVSNMVTGGLASGIGWVLGAPPVREHE